MGYDMYQENILDYYKHPRNKGTVDGADISFTENNPLCGDELTFSFKSDGDAVKPLLFSGKGCAISQAAASMLAEELEGKSEEEIASFGRAQMLEMIGVELSPAREKCGLLGLRVLKEALYILQAKREGTPDMAAIHERLSNEGLIF